MEVAINAQARSPFLNDRGMSPVESTRKALAQKANLVALVDLPRLAARYSKVMAEIQPAEGEVARLKDLEFKPSYLGVSVTIGAGSIASTTYIPFEQAEGLNELMKPYVPYIQMFVPFGTAGPPPIEFQPKFGGGSREKGR